MAETFHLFESLAGANPDRTIGWRRGAPIGFQQFVSRVRAWRSALQCHHGHAFALYREDAIEFASALFGAWYAGKVIYLPGDNLAGTCARLSAVVDGFLGEFAAEWSPVIAPEETGIERADFEHLEGDCTGLILYTSGSTGAPVAIAKKLEQLAREVATLESQFGALLGAAEIVATVSHQHIYGLLFRVLWPLAYGRALHAEAYSYFEDLTIALSLRACVLVSSPAHLQRLATNLRWSEARKRVRAVFSSGAPLALEAAQETNRLLGSIPIEVYGSSETGGIAWRQQRTRSDEAWLPFPGVNWRLEPNQAALEIRSPHLANDSWFRTGDSAKAAVAPNRFLLDGRIDRIAKIEGKRISLGAIESALKNSPLVRDARVVVVEGARQRIAALVIPSEQGWHQLTLSGKLVVNGILRNELSQWIDPVGLPRIWRYIEMLPVNAQGKTTAAELMALLKPKTTAPTEPHERLLERGANRVVFELTAPRNLQYFDGHFSGHPIVPGVVQVDWVIAYGKRCFDLPPVFRAIRGLKFQRVIPPDLPITLELSYQAAGACLCFRISSQCGSHASGRVLFGAADV